MTGSKPRTPRTIIPATTVIRRPTAQKWHLLRPGSVNDAGGYARTECGQVIRAPVRAIVHNAGGIGCFECLSDAISRRLREQRPIPKVTP